jgi:folate-binding protein YgfZ
MSDIWSTLPIPAPVAHAPVLLVPLPHESVLSIQGPDSEKFLQGQSTADFREVTPGTSRLGCLCNLKGRATLSFRAVNWLDSYLLVMDQALRESARTTLQKYIIFSKAQISLPDVAVFGMIGEEAEAEIRQHFGNCPAGTDDVMTVEDTAIIRLPGSGRFLLLMKAESLTAHWENLSSRLPIGTLNAWRLAQIRAGECQVLAAGAEQFQPQELNLQELNGISYNKGCYTGQEIIARLYFRGKLKQWAHRFAVAAMEAPPVNTPLVNAEGQTAGHIVLAAVAGDGQVELLAITRHDQQSGLKLAGGSKELTPLPLPYTVTVRE